MELLILQLLRLERTFLSEVPPIDLVISSSPTCNITLHLPMFIGATLVIAFFLYNIYYALYIRPP